MAASTEKGLDAQIKDFNLKLNRVLLSTDINDPDYLKKSVDIILTEVKDVLGFNCADFFLFRNLDGTIPRIGEIGPDPRKSKDMRLHWITGVGYEEDYFRVALGASYDVSDMQRGPPETLFFPEYDFKELLIFDDKEYMKKLEKEGRFLDGFFKRMQKIYETECNPADFQRGGFSEWFYQIFIPVTRMTTEGKEMIGLICIDTPQDIPLNEPPSAEKMAAVKDIVELAELPIMTASMVDELNKKNVALDLAYTDLRDAQAAIILQEKLSSLGMLSASIAHGVHNPLFALSVSTRRLEELTGRLGSDWQKLESQGLSAEDRRTLQELLTTIGRGPTDRSTYLA